MHFQDKQSHFSEIVNVKIFTLATRPAAAAAWTLVCEPANVIATDSKVKRDFRENSLRIHGKSCAA